MNIVITGTSSGVGKELFTKLSSLDHTVIAVNRCDVNLADTDSVLAFTLPKCDMLINCAGTGIGGKTDFVHHKKQDIVTIFNTNLLSVLLLSHQALENNPHCKIVNVTSTNNKHYWPNDLAYSLTKQAVKHFGLMLQVEYPECLYLEVQLGLTKTNFNSNRYKDCQERFIDIYGSNKHLSSDQAASKIIDVLFNNHIKFIEVSP